MSSEPALDGVYARLLPASAGETDFAASVRAMTEAFGAAGGVAYECDRRTGRIGPWVGFGLEAGEREYQERMIRINPRIRPAMRHAPGFLVHEAMFIDERTMSRHEFYDWLNRRHGLRYFIGMRGHDAGERSLFVSVEFERRHGPPTPGALSASARLGPAFGNAWRLARRVRRPAPAAGATPWTPDHLPWAILALDRAGRVVEANRQARAMLADGGILTLEDGWPCPVDAQSRGPFANALRRALRGDSSDARLRPAMGRVPLLAQVIPTAAGRTPASPDIAAVLYLRDPRAVPADLGPTLARVYGFTEAECRLALLLARGEALGEAAATLGTSRNTARNHLQAMFAKTGTRRQTDLLLHISSLLTPAGAG